MRTYTANSGDVSCVASTEKTILELEGNGTNPFKVKGFRITFKGVSSSAAPVRVRIVRASADNTGGSTVTPRPKNTAVAAATVTARINGAPEATADDIAHEFYVHPQGGHHEPYIPPGEEWDVPATGRFAMQVLADADVTASGEFTFSE